MEEGRNSCYATGQVVEINCLLDSWGGGVAVTSDSADQLVSFLRLIAYSKEGFHH